VYSGITVNLLDSSGAVVATTTTDASGKYSFPGITPGSYTVKVDTSTLPAGLTETFDVDGGADSTTAVTVGSTNVTGIDYGYVAYASVGDRVWLDADGDGLQSSGESGFAGVPVVLKDASGATVATTTTAADGSYLFEKVLAGSYTVVFTPPAGYAATVTGVGSDSGVDSNGVSAAVSLVAGQRDVSVDLGVVGVGVIGDTIYNDVNADGTQGAGEPGLAGVSVSLKDASGVVVATTTTDASGHYAFVGLVPGDYTVSVDASTLPAGVSQTGFPAGASGLTSQVSLTPGAMTNNDQDFGFHTPAAVPPVDPVTPVDAAPGGAVLPQTGTNAQPWVLALGVLLAGAGGVTILVGRRRRG
jgi:serine-aspartate repeat-containing protein C/D/E